MLPRKGIPFRMGGICLRWKFGGICRKKWRNYWADWTRLRNAVYVTFPYAKRASVIMNEINARLVNVSDRKQRKAIIKSREKELKKEFTDKLTNPHVLCVDT
eukprot:Opistho-2@48776